MATRRVRRLLRRSGLAAVRACADYRSFSSDRLRRSSADTGLRPLLRRSDVCVGPLR